MGKDVEIPESGLGLVVGTPQWYALTDRRAELIYRKNREGLLREEIEELEGLDAISRGVIARTYSAPLGGDRCKKK